MSQYIQCLRYLLTSFTADIVLGDFNINYFNDNQVEHLKSLMDSLNYSQIVKKPTFVSSVSLLDHVYVSLSVVEIIEYDIVTVYYSCRQVHNKILVLFILLGNICTIRFSLY